VSLIVVVSSSAAERQGDARRPSPSALPGVERILLSRSRCADRAPEVGAPECALSLLRAGARGCAVAIRLRRRPRRTTHDMLPLLITCYVAGLLGGPQVAYNHLAAPETVRVGASRLAQSSAAAMACVEMFLCRLDVCARVWRGFVLFVHRVYLSLGVPFRSVVLSSGVCQCGLHVVSRARLVRWRRPSRSAVACAHGAAPLSCCALAAAPRLPTSVVMPPPQPT